MQQVRRALPPSVRGAEPQRQRQVEVRKVLVAVTNVVGRGRWQGYLIAIAQYLNERKSVVLGVLLQTRRRGAGTLIGAQLWRLCANH